MLSTAKTLKGYKLDSLDGDIGKVNEFYFDDQHWTIRYLIADTGSWLKGRQVLLSPYALTDIITKNKSVTVNLTKKQIENSPSVDEDQPVSRQFEDDYYGYYGWPMYWDGPYSWGRSTHLMRGHERWSDQQHGEKSWDPHLRSTHEVHGYHLQATDGEIGHVVDFIIDDETWAIRYLIVDTQNWWPGKKILVAPQWIDRVSWTESKVFVNLTRSVIKNSPEFNETSLVSRDYESLLFGHYNRRGYWVDEVVESVLAP